MFHTTWILALLCLSTACGGPISPAQETSVPTPGGGAPSKNSQDVTSPTSAQASMPLNVTEEDSPETLAESDRNLTQAVAEGDILLPEDRLAVQGLWPDAIVPYTINPSLTDQMSDIRAAFHMISSSTCIRFKARTAETSYLWITRGSGCASFVGFRGGLQLLMVSPSCKTGSISHELIHALGLHHEHIRPDRDQHVTVVWRNIHKGKEKNFRIKGGDTMNLPYDLASIMHYGRKFFSKNGQSTLVEKDKDHSVQAMGQRSHLTKLDVQKLRQLYGCDER